jgi:hypothetical protein
MQPLSTNDIEKMLINPFYCIQFDEDLSMEHEPLISEELWISANIKMIREIGIESWLQGLLQVLQGDYVGNKVLWDDRADRCDCE